MPEVDYVQLLLQGGSFGLLCIIVISLIRYAPRLIQDIRADRESALKMYHDDRMASLEAARQDRHELRDSIQGMIAQVIAEHNADREAFEQQMKYERESCDRRLDRICVSVEKSQASTDRAIEQITRAIEQLETVAKHVTKAVP
jgi:hypothetical protein